jgi:hypothetical protein
VIANAKKIIGKIKISQFPFVKGDIVVVAFIIDRSFNEAI